METEEQPEALVKLGASPVRVRAAQCLALPKPGMVRIRGDILEDEVADGSKELHGRSAPVPLRVACAGVGGRIADRLPAFAK
jgi:hypothetical protein